MLAMILFRHVGCRYLKYFYLDKSRRRTNGWYSHYQALVCSVPAVGTECTNDWYQFHTVTISWMYAAIRLPIATLRRSCASTYKEILIHSLLF